MEPRPEDFITYQCSIHIDAPPERVWELAGDLGKSAKWAGSGAVVAMTKTTDGPVGVGTRYIADEKIGVSFQSETLITEYEPNRLIIWHVRPIGSRMLKMPEGRAHRWAFRLEPENGGTRLTHELCAARAAGLVRVMQIMGTTGPARNGFLRGITRTLDNIKSMAESSRVPAGASA